MGKGKEKVWRGDGSPSVATCASDIVVPHLLRPNRLVVYDLSSISDLELVFGQVTYCKKIWYGISQKAVSDCTWLQYYFYMHSILPIATFILRVIGCMFHLIHDIEA